MKLQKKLECYLPLALGSYCLVQGAELVASDNGLIKLLGIALLLWVPACGYYTWRGFRGMTPKPAPAQNVWKDDEEPKLAA